MEKNIEKRANRVLVGGVSAAWNYLADGPVYVKKAYGSHFIDVNGKEYIDYIMGWGSLFQGHNPNFIKEVFEEVNKTGFAFQYETIYHVKLAEKIVEHVPCAEKVRLCNSGTEATMNALRLARTVTGKNKVLKFEGHFHGHHDNLLFSMDTSPFLGKQINGLYEPIAGSSGIPNNIKDNIIVVPFNNEEALERAFETYKNDIACVIMEPISLNIGCIKPKKGFLQFIRDICDKNNTLLVFDEVLTGFRVALGGAQEVYRVIPDLACIGKAFGCGFSIAALVGKAKYMDCLQPVGKSEMSGTNTGRIINVIGTLKAIEQLEKPHVYEEINKKQNYFIEKLNVIINKYNIKCFVQGAGGRIGIHFGLDRAPIDYRDIIKNWDGELTNKCYKKAIEKGLYGVFLPLSNCPEPITLSISHTYEDLNLTLDIIDDIFDEVINND